MPIGWIEHKTRKILYIDLRGASTEEMLKVVEEQKRMIDAASAPVLLLNDFRGTYATQEYMNKAKEYGKLQKDKIARNAVLGIQGVKSILLGAYIRFSGSSNTKMFDDVEQAKEYLVN